MSHAHRSYYVYILASRPHGTIYTGITGAFTRRLWQHKNEILEGFTQKYGVKRLVYFEEFREVDNAIAREKEIKGWLRVKKIMLIQRANPLWKDLSEGWFGSEKSEKNSEL